MKIWLFYNFQCDAIFWEIYHFMSSNKDNSICLRQFCRLGGGGNFSPLPRNPPMNYIASMHLSSNITKISIALPNTPFQNSTTIKPTIAGSKPTLNLAISNITANPSLASTQLNANSTFAAMINLTTLPTMHQSTISPGMISHNSFRRRQDFGFSCKKQRQDDPKFFAWYCLQNSTEKYKYDCKCSKFWPNIWSGWSCFSTRVQSFPSDG